MKRINFILLGFLTLICACSAPETPFRTDSLTPPIIRTDTPSPPTGTDRKTNKPQRSTHTPTSHPRWTSYEDALASTFLFPKGSAQKGLCEWEILGQKNREVYVWAMCQIAANAEGQAMSAPAVIRLGENGNVRGVEVPRDGSYYGPDIRKLFPRRVENIIFEHEIDTGSMWDHIQKRHRTPEAPLIVLSETPLP